MIVDGPVGHDGEPPVPADGAGRTPGRRRPARCLADEHDSGAATGHAQLVIVLRRSQSTSPTCLVGSSDGSRPGRVGLLGFV